MRQKAYSATPISEMSNNFGKLCKICSLNLIGIDSGGFWLKTFRLAGIWDTGHMRGIRGLQYSNFKWEGSSCDISL